MATAISSSLVETVRAAAEPLHGAAEDYNSLLEMIGDARFVLLGEASHGTHEFYRARALITQRLIDEKGFNAVAVEADWPDAYRVNCYVRGVGDDRSADEALGGFKRFPTWMWRNADVLAFVELLRAHNQALAAGAPKVGFYGLDLYSLGASIEAVIDYLDSVDPEAARRARARYACFDHLTEEPQAYGYATSSGRIEPCENAVIEQLLELQRRSAELAGGDGKVAEEEYFYAEQNARLAVNAEEYYRSMFRGRASSWNLRDQHMAETLDALVAHLERDGAPAKVVVWEHNSHLGDARATEMGQGGEWNVGQLVRQRYDREAVLVGFSTYTGTVTAASDWGDPPERKNVRPGLRGSYEELFHQTGVANFLLRLRDRPDLHEELREPRLQRAIGVIYRPETERLSHYFHTRLPEQFDAMIHFDQTRAVVPLDRSPFWEQGQAPETFPSGL